MGAKLPSMQLTKKQSVVLIGCLVMLLVLFLRFSDLSTIFAGSLVRDSRLLQQARTKMLQLNARLESTPAQEDLSFSETGRNFLKEPPPPPPAEKGEKKISREELIKQVELPRLLGILATRNALGQQTYRALFQNGTVTQGDILEGFYVLDIDERSVVLSRYGTTWRILQSEMPFANKRQ